MDKKLIAINSSVYIGFEIFNKSLPFIVLVYFSNFLGPEQTGHVAEFMAIIGFLGVFVGLSSHGAVGIAFFKEDPSNFPEYIFNVLVLVMVSTVFVLIALTAYRYFFNYFSLSVEWMWAAALACCGQFITQINLTVWQVEKKPLFYGLFQTFLSVTYAGVAILAVMFIEKSWYSIAGSYIVTYLFFGFFSVIFLHIRKLLRYNFSLKWIKDAISFGVPLMPHVLSGWVFLGYNIFLIKDTLGMEQAGVFNMAMQFVLVLNVIALAVNKAYSPFAYDLIKQDTDATRKNLISITFTGFAFMVLLSIFVGGAGFWGIRLFMSPEFHESSNILISLIISGIFNACYFLVVIFLYYEKKTGQIASITFFVALVHLLLSKIFIEYFGTIGIAYSLGIVGFLKFIITWFLANKAYPLFARGNMH